MCCGWGVAVLVACAGPSAVPDPGVRQLDLDSGTSADAPGSDLPLFAPSVEVEVAAARPCARPEARAERPFDERPVSLPVPAWPYVAGAGVAVADLDADGVVDVVLNSRSEVAVVWGAGAGETARTSLGGVPFGESTAPKARQGLFAPHLVDLDADGDLDLYVTAIGKGNVVLRNDGGRAFTRVGDALGLAGPDDHPSAGASFADMDLDGDLDAFVAGFAPVDEEGTEFAVDLEPGAPSLLFENLGDGSFRDVSDRLPASVQGEYTFLGAWLDLAGDARPDLFLGNDFVTVFGPSRVLTQEGPADAPRFVDDERLGLSSMVIGMGLGVGDVNGDAIPDLVMPGWRDVGLLVSDGGEWYESADASGMVATADRQTVAWGAVVADFNNDRLADVFVGYGGIRTAFGRNSAIQPDALFLAEASGQFRDVADAWGVNWMTNTRGLAAADINGDGWLDLVMSTVSGVARVATARCGEAAWLVVAPRDATSANPFSVGATVLVEVAGDVLRRDLLAGGSGFASSGPMEVAFGLGAAERVDRVRVRWPDGEEAVLEDVDARQRLTITRTARAEVPRPRLPRDAPRMAPPR